MKRTRISWTNLVVWCGTACLTVTVWTLAAIGAHALLTGGQP